MISNRKHFEALRALDQRHADRLRDADKEAIKVLADNFERRMANTNEWRQVVESSQKAYVTRGQVFAALTTALVIIGLILTYYANFGVGR